MQLTVKGKHLDVGDALKSHVESSLQGVFGKYFGNPIEANVVRHSRHILSSPSGSSPR